MAELEQIVQRLEATLGPAAGPPVPLPGGITNRNYRLRLGGHDCVLRLAGEQTELLGISREAELIAADAAARLGIAPPLLAAQDGCLVTAYVPGGPLGADGARHHVEALGSALRRFHDCGARLPAEFWVPELLESYAALVSERGRELPGAYHSALELVDEIAAQLPLEEPVPCHNDLLGANLLPGPGDGVLLVDWEYAGMGHRSFDVGNLAVNNELSEAEEERLLSAYLGQPPSPAQRAGVRLMRIVSDAREAAWGVVQAVVSKLDYDFEAYAQRHFERLEAAAADPRMEQWLDAASA